jgi:hypothetical protein
VEELRPFIRKYYTQSTSSETLELATVRVSSPRDFSIQILSEKPKAGHQHGKKGRSPKEVS